MKRASTGQPTNRNTHLHAQLAYMKLELAGASVTVLALIVLIALFGLGPSLSF